jgi:hypothetical protein
MTNRHPRFLMIAETVFYVLVSIYGAACCYAINVPLDEFPGWEFLAVVNAWFLRPDPTAHPRLGAVFVGGSLFGILAVGQMVRKNAEASLNRAV